LPSEVTKFAQNAIEEAISYSTLGIASEDGTVTGTAIAVDYKAQCSVITNKHIVDDIASGPFWFYFRPDAPLIRAPKKDFGNHINKVVGSERFRFSITRTLTSGPLDDLAVLVIDPSIVPSPLLRFHRIQDDRRTPEVESCVVLFGFPSELLRLVGPLKERSTGRVGYMTFGNFEWRTIVEQECRDLESFDSTRHFLIDFSGEMNSDKFVAHPRGMSGCGVWTYPPFTEGDLWDPTKVELVGVQSSWYKDRRLMKAIKIERLLAVLKGL
jgi:hypothetical protein